MVVILHRRIGVISDLRPALQPDRQLAITRNGAEQDIVVVIIRCERRRVEFVRDSKGGRVRLLQNWRCPNRTCCTREEGRSTARTTPAVTSQNLFTLQQPATHEPFTSRSPSSAECSHAIATLGIVAPAADATSQIRQAAIIPCQTQRGGSESPSPARCCSLRPQTPF